MNLTIEAICHGVIWSILSAVVWIVYRWPDIAASDYRKKKHDDN